MSQLHVICFVSCYLHSVVNAFAPKPETEEDRRRQADMVDIFEREEATLQHKSIWNLFR